MKYIVLVVLSCLLLSVSPAYSQTVAVIGINDVQLESSDDSQELSEQLKAEFKNKLLATRKFKILERSQAERVLSDRRLTLEMVADDGSTDVQFDVPGMDYVLNAKVVGLNVNSESTVVQADLRSTSYPLSSVAIEASIAGQSDGENSSEQVSALADAMVREVVATIFPVRVMHVSEEGLVTLNYGKGLLSPGETLNVFAPVNAPTNGAVEPGGVNGPPVATLEIVDANIKFSTAQITSGNEDLQRGFKAKPNGN